MSFLTEPSTAAVIRPFNELRLNKSSLRLRAMSTRTASAKDSRLATNCWRDLRGTNNELSIKQDKTTTMEINQERVVLSSKLSR